MAAGFGEQGVATSVPTAWVLVIRTSAQQGRSTKSPNTRGITKRQVSPTPAIRTANIEPQCALAT